MKPGDPDPVAAVGTDRLPATVPGQDEDDVARRVPVEGDTGATVAVKLIGLPEPIPPGGFKDAVTVVVAVAGLTTSVSWPSLEA